MDAILTDFFSFGTFWQPPKTPKSEKMGTTRFLGKAHNMLLKNYTIYIISTNFDAVETAALAVTDIVAARCM